MNTVHEAERVVCKRVYEVLREFNPMEDPLLDDIIARLEEELPFLEEECVCE